MHRTVFAATSGFLLAACGPGSMPPQDAGRDIQRLEGGNNSIALSPAFAFEGQRRYVGILGPSQGQDDLSMATVTTPPGSPIVIERVECSRIRCGIVAHIEDTVPNRGTPVPEPTSGEQFAITVVGRELNYSAPLQVFPLDTADAAALGTGQIASQAVYSSLVIPAGSTLRATMQEQAVRFAVMNRADVQGTFDFSGVDAAGGPGGHAGGAPPGGDGQGPQPGVGSTVAGGGGGNAEPGGNGAGADGTAAGMGGAATDDPLIARLRGGSGGGAGPDGAGGGGGGAFALAVFGEANLDGARFLFRGAAGQGTGGGGAGGTLVLGGVPAGAFTVDVSGGAGGAGRVRIDGQAAGATVTGGQLAAGVRFDIASIPPLVREPSLTVRGFAAPGTRVRVQNELNGVVGARAEATADAEGNWQVPFMLAPGATTLVAYAVMGTTAVPSFSGTTVVIRGSAGAREIRSGAVDVVYVPMSE